LLFDIVVFWKGSVGGGVLPAWGFRVFWFCRVLAWRGRGALRMSGWLGADFEPAQDLYAKLF